MLCHVITYLSALPNTFSFRMQNSPLVLVIGTGSIGERHLRCLQKTARCRLSFCEPMEERRREVATRYGIETELAFPTLEAALSSGQNFTAAVVSAPAPFHIPMGRELAERGIHILMEKPLSLSLDGVEDFRNLIEKKEIVVAIGYTHRAHPGMMRLKEIYDSGEFGQAIEMRIDVGQPFAKIRPAYPDVYFADRAMGGGAIQDMITHFYSVGDWLLGPIDELVTHARHQALPRVEVEDTVHTLALHGKVMATYAQNLTQPQNEATLTLICEQGSIRTDYAKKRISLIREPNGEWEHTPFTLDDIDEIYITQNSAFLDALENKAPVLCTLEEAIRTLRVNLASLKSAETKTWQSLS